MDILSKKTKSIVILRQKAEELLKKSASNSDLSFPTYQTLELIHELEVHQLELEMQNEELMQSQTLAQNAVDLYNYAPNGYFTLSENAMIIDLNNTGATLLKKEKSELIGSTFAFFVTDETKPILAKFLQKVLRDKKRESCEITLSISGKIEIFVQLTGVVDKTGDQCLVTTIDVSEKKQAELALKESDERFQLLFNKAPLGYQSLDINGMFIEVNQQWLDMLGYTREEVIGKWFGDFMPPNYQELVKLNFPKFREQGHIHTEFEMIHKNGTSLFIAFDGKIGYSTNGEFKQTHCILQDVTQQRKLEFALSKSEEKFRNTFENSIVGISLTSIDGKLSVNKAFCDIVGYSEDELKQLNWKEITYKGDEELNERIVQSILKREKDSERWEKRYIHKNGNIVWVDISTSLQRDEAGAPLFFITTINDITDRKRAEKELHESREQFKDLFENAPVGYHEIDVEGRIVRMNKTELDMLGYSADEVIGHFFWEFTPDKEFSKKSISAKLKGDAISHDPFEREFCRIDGTRIPVLIQDVMLRDEVGNILGIRSTVQDITERKKTEIALRNSEEKFKKAFMTSPDSININRMDDGMYVSINTGFTRILGYTEEDILGKTSTEKNIWCNQSDRNKLIDGLKANGIVENLIAQFRSISGELVYGMLSASIIELDGIKHILNITRDITDIKKVENELLEKEVQYRNLANSGTALIWAAGLDKLCFYFNEPWLKFTGRTLEQESGNGWVEGVHPDDFDHCLNTYVTSFDKRVAFEMEYRMRNAEGEYRWILDLGKPNYNGAGEFIGYIGHCFDITERKRADEALRETQAILKAAMDNSQAGIAIADAPDGRLRYVNNAGLYIRGEVKEKIVDNVDLNKYVNSWQLLDLDHRVLESEEVPLARAILFGETNSREFIIRRETGEDRIVLAKAAPIRNDKNEVIAAVVVFHDITDRKKAELALLESEKKLSTLFASMTEMVVMHELVLNEIGEAIDYRIIDCNDTFTQITGIEKENAIGKLATEVYQTDRAPYLEEYTKVCITGQSIEYKTYFAPMDKHFLISAVSTGINQFATITTDITAIQKNQEIITEKNKELENYIYVASHDLRSPLVNIQGFSQRLEKQANELKKVVLDNIVGKKIKSDIEKIANEDIPKSIGFILSNVLKMDTLINGLLQLSRTGRIVMTIRKIDMNKLLKSILSAHNYELTEIEANVEIDNLADCYGDENQLNQLFSNIIDNAIKYRDKSRKLQLKISSQDFFNRVVYSVKDSGIGINPRHLEKIWDVFYRVDASSPEAGEGIGLSLARRIVDKHEGKIWVESEEGKGSTFFIELQKTEFGE